MTQSVYFSQLKNTEFDSTCLHFLRSPPWTSNMTKYNCSVCSGQEEFSVLYEWYLISVLHAVKVCDASDWFQRWRKWRKHRRDELFNQGHTAKKVKLEFKTRLSRTTSMLPSVFLAPELYHVSDEQWCGKDNLTYLRNVTILISNLYTALSSHSQE